MADVIGGGFFSEKGLLDELRAETGEQDVASVFAALGKEGEVKTANLIAVQPVVNRDTLIGLIKIGGVPHETDQPVKIVKIGAKRYVIDGTHRLAAARQLGLARINAVELDLTARMRSRKPRE
jgi:hypothetical protein